jgi:hypothetical protein
MSTAIVEVKTVEDLKGITTYDGTKAKDEVVEALIVHLVEKSRSIDIATLPPQSTEHAPISRLDWRSHIVTTTDVDEKGGKKIHTLNVDVDISAAEMTVKSVIERGDEVTLSHAYAKSWDALFVNFNADFAKVKLEKKTTSYVLEDMVTGAAYSYFSPTMVAPTMAYKVISREVQNRLLKKRTGAMAPEKFKEELDKLTGDSKLPLRLYKM